MFSSLLFIKLGRHLKNQQLLKCFIFFRDTGISLQIQMYQLYSEIFVFFTYLFLTSLLSFLNPIYKISVGRVIQSVIQFILYVVQPLFYLHGDASFRNICVNQGMWFALKKAIFNQD